MKKLTIKQFLTVKRVAQNVSSLVATKNRLAKKINELNAEYNEICAIIDGHEVGIRRLTGGLSSEDLVERVVTISDKTDKDGKPIKTYKFVPKEGVIKFNEEDKLYEITESTPLENVDKVDTLDVSSIDDSPLEEVEVPTCTTSDEECYDTATNYDKPDSL